MPTDDSTRWRFDMKRLRSVADLLATLLVVVAASAVIALTVRNWRQVPTQSTPPPPSAPEVPKAPQSIDGAPTIGRASAPIAMVIYSDFQCPFCGRFARETWPSIKKDFVDTGRVLIVFRNLPLPNHPEAKPAALAAQCAAQQGKFWDFHDLVFHNQQQLAPQAQRVLASQVGVNLTEFDNCMQHQSDAAVVRDIQSAQSLAINGTPTFLIGRMQPNRTVQVLDVIVGAQPEQRFRKAFEEASAIRSVSE